MNRVVVSLMAAVAVMSVVMASCTQAAPAPAPTQAPAAVPTKAPEPTKAAAPAAPTAAPAAPTQAAAPAKKVDFPAKGKAVSVIVPYAAGGDTSLAAQIMGAALQKELGSPVEVLHKPGGGAQVGLTELAGAKPDGYTLGYTVLPTASLIYLDPERKATFTRKSFEPVAYQYELVAAVFVSAKSPYMNLKDLLDAAKAKPEGIKLGSTGFMAFGHVGGLMLEENAGVRFATVHFDGGAPAITALMGGHVDVYVGGIAQPLSGVKSGDLRCLAVLAKQEDRSLPGVKTAEAQGYKVYLSVIAGVSGPAGIPKEASDILSAAARKAMDSDEHNAKMAQLGFETSKKSPGEFATAWAEMETAMGPLVQRAKLQQK